MKRFTTILLILAMVLTMLPIGVGAAAGPSITLGNATVQQGSTFTVSITAADFAAVGTVDFNVYYDPEVLSLSSTANGGMIDGETAFLTVNADTPGVIKFTAITMDTFAASGTLARLTFTAASTAPAGAHPLTLTVGDAYGVDLMAIAVSGISGSVTVTEKAQTAKQFSLSGYLSGSPAQCGDTVTLRLANSNYYGNGYTFSSADFVIEFDSDIFAVEAVELESELKKENAVYSINTDISGMVRISYASADAVSTFYLLTLKLKVTSDVAGTSKLSYSASNVYAEDLSQYLPYSGTTTVTLNKLPEVVDYPNMWLQSEALIVGRQTASTLYLQKGAGVAAGDFVITYDPSVLRCLGVSVAGDVASTGGMIVVNDSFDDGTIEFPYVNSEGYGDTDIALVDIIWEALASPATHHKTVISGSMVYDADFGELTLEYLADSGCIHTPTVTASDCTEGGYTTYVCGCGDTYVADHVAALGHDIQPMDAKAPTCTEPGWDAHTACVRCGGEGNRVEIPALGHDFSPESVTEPSCTVGGYTTYICTVCGADKIADPTAPLGHDSIYHEGKTPTCQEPGWADYETCSRCDHNTYQDLPIADHNYMGKSCIFCGITRESTQQMDLSVDADGTVMAYIYENSDGTVSLEIAGNGPIKDYTSSPFSSFSGRIGDIYIADGITHIGNRLFYNAQTTGQLHIADTVTTIGDYAFSGISGPRWVSIPAGVTAIGNFAFYLAKGLVITLEGDTLPGSLGSIWDYNCGHYLNPQQVIVEEDATYVIDSSSKAWLAKYCLDEEEFFPKASIEGIPVTGIGAYAFYDKTRMITFTVPAHITDVQSNAFANCKNLTVLTESPNKPGSLSNVSTDTPPCYAAPQRVIRTKDGLYVVDKDGQLHLARYLGSDTDVILPSHVEELPLRFIGDNAFNSRSCQSVILPDTVEELGGYCFYSSNVKQIRLPDSLTKIGTWCFFSGDLTSVTIPKNVSTIERSAFSYCSDLATVYIASTAIAQMITSTDSCGDLCKYAKNVVISAAVENSFLQQTYAYTDATHAFGTDCMIYSSCAHDWVQTSYKEAVPCVSDGQSLHECAVCSMEKLELIPRHDLESVAAKAPDCTEIGWDDHWECTRCDYTTANELPALGHRIIAKGDVSVYPLEVDNSAAVPFRLQDGIYYSDNHVDNTASDLYFTAQYPCTLELRYGVSSETNYDKLIILHNSEQKDMVSGEVADASLVLTLAAGDIVTVRYSKDVSSSVGQDMGWVKPICEDVVITSEKDYPADSMKATCLGDLLCSYCQEFIKPAGDHSYTASLDCRHCGEPSYSTEDGVMKLQRDITLSELTVSAEQVLDLNGHTLKAESAVCFGGITDSVGTGLLAVDAPVISSAMCLPVYDSAAGGYRLLRYSLRCLGVRENSNGSVCFGFAIELDSPQLYSLLADQDSGVSITAQLCWGEEARSFAFDAALLAQYAQLQEKYPALTPALLLTVSGLDSLAAGTQLQVLPGLTAASVLNLAWDELTYTVPQ